MSQKILLECLQGKTTIRPPFWFMRQAGRYLPEYRQVRASCQGFLDLCFTPRKAAEVTLQPIRRFGMDAAILFSDILVIPHALGQKVEFKEGEGPVLEPIQDISLDLPSWDPENFISRLSPVFETIDRIKSELPKETALIGFSGSPWTLACYMLQGKGGGDFTAARELLWKKPESYSALNDRLVEAITLYLDCQIRAGVEVIQLFDSWSGILESSLFERWVIASTKTIVSRLKTLHPNIPVIGFPRMAGIHYMNYAKHTGVNAVSLDFTVPMHDICTLIPKTIIKQGNIDPLLLAADKQEALHHSEELCRKMASEHFIFNLGHGMLPQTPVEHVEALCRQLRQ